MCEVFGSDRLSVRDLRRGTLSSCLGIMMCEEPAPFVLETQQAIAAALKFPDAIAEMAEMFFIDDLAEGDHPTKKVIKFRLNAFARCIEPLFGFHVPVSAPCVLD